MSDLVLGADGRPDFIDGVDDFKRYKWEAAGQDRAKAEKIRKAAADSREKVRSIWVSEGQGAMGQLKAAKGGVEAILGPHLLKKNCGIELLDWVRKFENSQEKRLALYKTCVYPVRLLFYIRPPFTEKRSKTEIIRWKWVVMRELRRYLARNPQLNTDGAVLSAATTETKALRKMEVGQRSLVPLRPEDLVVLYENRDKKRFHEDKLDVVQRLLDKWAKVPSCKSLLHTNPAGCPVCDAILMGGTRDPTEYVRAISRESGLEKMEKLSQELLYLNEEKNVEHVAIQRCMDEIAGLERIMFKLARDSIQSWWVAVLARRRSNKEDGARRKSLFYFRIRRLLRMKKQIDITIDADMNFSVLRIRYSEIVPELKEYMAKVAADRADLGIKMGKVFIQKLRKAVAKARRKKYMAEEMIIQEKAAAQEIVKKKKNAAALLAMRKLVRTIEKRKFICIRERCEGRAFVSVERYNAHMSIHKVEDSIRSKKILGDKLQRIHKEQEANSVTERVAAIRAAVFEFANEHKEEETKRNLRKLLIDPQSVDLGDGMYAKPSNWNAQPHLRIINQEKNALLYTLQLISKRGDVEAPATVALNIPNFQFGTLPTSQCTFIATGQTKRDGCLAKTHCVIIVPGTADYDEPIRVHDNHSLYGTYIVSGASDGAIKATTSPTDGNVLEVGDLLCIGVKKYGAAVLSASEASGACIVYRVKCKALQEGD